MKNLYFIAFLSLLFSCGSVHKAKYGLENDYYIYKEASKQKKKVYLKHYADHIEIFNLDSSDSERIEPESKKNMPEIRLSRPSFDLDLTTTFLKMRPKQPDLPTSFSKQFERKHLCRLSKRYLFYQIQERTFWGF